MKHLELLYEGIYDPCTYKALFVIGGPGSGKSYVTKKLGLVHMGLVQLNSDYALEKYMKRAGLDLKMPPHEKEERDEVRSKAKDVTISKEESVFEQRLGVFIDGTGADKDSLAYMEGRLTTLGYDTAMLFVNTDLETAMRRNQERDRTVPKNIALEKWKDVQKNIGFYQNYFDDFFVIDNSDGSNFERQIQQVYKKLLKWCKSPKSKRAEYEIQKEKERRGINIQKR